MFWLCPARPCMARHPAAVSRAPSTPRRVDWLLLGESGRPPSRSDRRGAGPLIPRRRAAPIPSAHAPFEVWRLLAPHHPHGEHPTVLRGPGLAVRSTARSTSSEGEHQSRAGNDRLAREVPRRCGERTARIRLGTGGLVDLSQTRSTPQPSSLDHMTGDPMFGTGPVPPSDARTFASATGAARSTRRGAGIIFGARGEERLVRERVVEIPTPR